MPELLHAMENDQAAGLRRLFGARPPKVVAFISGQDACGRTTLMVQSAAALAQAGQGVVVIDEHAGPDNLLSAFGVSARHDLMDLAQGTRTVHQIMVPAAPNVFAVSAVRLANELNHVDAIAADQLNRGLRQISQGASFVLIDCAPHRGGHLSPLALAARHMTVVVAAQSSAITRAYALIKRMTKECARSRFHVVVTRARSTQDAQAIYDNLRRTALEHLGVQLDYLGAARVPATDHLADALQTRLPSLGNTADDDGFQPFAPPVQAVWSRPPPAMRRLESVV